MGVTKSRKSKAKVKTKRSHLKLIQPALTTDSEGRVLRRHFVFHKAKNKINKD